MFTQSTLIKLLHMHNVTLISNSPGVGKKWRLIEHHNSVHVYKRKIRKTDTEYPKYFSKFYARNKMHIAERSVSMMNFFLCAFYGSLVLSYRNKGNPESSI